MESLLVKDQHSTTVPRNQPNWRMLVADASPTNLPT